MTSQYDKARHFHSLHVPFEPVILYNIWDAGSARSVARAGARAIATGSWSVAAAQGYADGEALPLDDALAVYARIVANTNLPVTIDFEGGYATDPPTVAGNVRRLLELGVVGLNFEDQVVNGVGLYSLADQAARLRAVRQAADALNVPAFINARTDVFLKAAPGTPHRELMDDAVARCAAYADAGADGLFVPGLTDKALIRQICEASALPVNVMITKNLEEFSDMAALGVARISFGPAPYIGLSAVMEREARAFYGYDPSR
jgi:2-methylisocitrate lyase-like PEP mutase family enzyme